MTSEYDGLGLSPELISRLEEGDRLGKARQAAKDEREAAEKANEHGLTGQFAEEFKARYITAVQDGRQKVRERVCAVLNSPEAEGRWDAARKVAIQWDLSAEQAIAKLASMPFETDEADAAANFILGAGHGG